MPSVTFRMVTRPRNLQTITWSLGYRTGTLHLMDELWEYTTDGSSGEIATLKVTAREKSRFVLSQILIDQQMPFLEYLTHGDDPYMHRNDGKDCEVKVTLK